MLPRPTTSTSCQYTASHTDDAGGGIGQGYNLFTMTAYTGESAKGCCSPAFS